MHKKEKESRTPIILLATAGFLFVTCILLFFIGPEMISARYSELKANDEKGPMGDAFGGTVGPVIAWIAAVLTFLAFYIQYEANKEQRLQFERQGNDTMIERFENRFFEMIRLHRANVEELDIQQKVHGRKVFTTFYFELRYIYLLLQKEHDTNPPSPALNLEELTNLAYLIYFFGIGHVTKNVFIDIAPKYHSLPFFEKTLSGLHKQMLKYEETEMEIANAKSRSDLIWPTHNNLIVDHDGKTAIFFQIYKPFTGHGTKVGHYYRHLYQAVKYVNDQDHPLFTDTLKYSYVKMLRAQLSNFEQVLFYYNAVSQLGKKWITKNYIREYKMIINLPLSFADFGITPAEKFKKEMEEIDDFFDWTAIKDGLS